MTEGRPGGQLSDVPPGLIRFVNSRKGVLLRHITSGLCLVCFQFSCKTLRMMTMSLKCT